jgi:hypothetical protein
MLAKAGIHFPVWIKARWMPAFAGMTAPGSCDFLAYQDVSRISQSVPSSRASSITGLMQRLANHFAYCLSLLLSKMDLIYWKWAANPEVLPYFFSTMLRKQRIFPVSRVLSQRA